VVCTVGFAVTELPVVALSVLPVSVHAYVEAPVADSVVVPPEGTVEGEAVTVTVGKASMLYVITFEYPAIPALVTLRRKYVCCVMACTGE
jgi:hypothetical protein